MLAAVKTLDCAIELIVITIERSQPDRGELYNTALLFNLDHKLDELSMLSMSMLSRILVNGARAELKDITKAYRDANDMSEMSAD